MHLYDFITIIIVEKKEKTTLKLQYMNPKCISCMYLESGGVLRCIECKPVYATYRNNVKCIKITFYYLQAPGPPPKENFL